MGKVSASALAEVRRALNLYLREVRPAVMKSRGRAAYLLRAESFVRWLADDYEPEARLVGLRLSPPTERELEAARAVYRCLLHQARVLERGRIAHSDLAAAVGMHPRRLGAALHLIQAQCHERGWPALTVWVAPAGSDGDVVAPEQVAETAEATKRIDWPAEP